MLHKLKISIIFGFGRSVSGATRMALLARLAELTFPQIPGGFEARIALLNDLSNGQQRSSLKRLSKPPLTTLERCTGLLQGAQPLSSLAAADVVGSPCGRRWCPEPGSQRTDIREHLSRRWRRTALTAKVRHHTQAGQRPRLRRVRHRQRPHEVAEVVGQHVKPAGRL